MEATSEQELRQLLDEGKVTEEEYNELRRALGQKKNCSTAVQAQEQTIAKPRTGFGWAALILMLAGILFPLLPIPFALMGIGMGGLEFKILLGVFFGIPCAILAFIFGIIGWKSPTGKAVVITIPILALLAVLLSIAGLVFAYPLMTSPSETVQRIRYDYPLDSLENVISRDSVFFDNETSSDGKGSLRIEAGSPGKKVIRIVETGPLTIANQVLIYSAKLRTGDFDGKAYLEMWCDIPGKGEFFSRGIEQPVTGRTEWTSVQTSFRFESRQMPANVKLNLIIEGDGTVWIDDIKLLSGPLIKE
ncbi:MAG: hypothetical protein LLF76_02125 [Planctomycetaceae bacterium]|nr:hypothetical protein [Planctomycetaceae bacterium]